MTFIARQTGGQGNYWHDRFDEALRFNREYAETMRNDGFLSGLLQERMLAVYALRHSWHLEVPNENDPFQKRVRDSLTATLRSIVPLGRMMWTWLDAIWYGKNGVQVQWGWTKSPDPDKQKALTILDWMPIQGDKIGHQFLDPETQHYIEQPYVLIDSAYAGELERTRNAEIVVTTLGQALLLKGDWRERFIIHKHLIEDSDWFFSDKAEAIHGVGVRSKIFWSNWLKWEWLANVTDFFDRVGLGITVWKYPQGNPQALNAIKQAANDQSNRAHIFVPIAPDSGKEQSGIERIEVPTSGSSFLLELIQYLDTVMERYVIGQEASSKGVSAGMGNEATADFQRATKANITLMDSDFLAETMTGSEREPGLVNTMKRCTYPEADFPVLFRFDMESGESEKKLTAIKTVVELGADVKTAEVRKAAGLSKPVEGDEVIKGKAPPMPGAIPGMPGAPGAPSPDMPPGTNPSGATPAQNGGSGIPQPGESGGTTEGGSAAPSGENPFSPETPVAAGATYEQANTGVSPETGQPFKDSRYVNPETGKVKHFPDAAGAGENGKPVDGKRVVTSGENPFSPEPAKAENPASEAKKPLDSNSPSVQPSGKLDRSAFEYTDHAKNPQEQCQVCRFFDGQQSKCHFFEQVNQTLPQEFSLDEKVQPTGWCNSFEKANQGQPNDANAS